MREKIVNGLRYTHGGRAKCNYYMYGRRKKCKRLTIYGGDARETKLAQKYQKHRNFFYIEPQSLEPQGFRDFAHFTLLTFCVII